MQSGGWQAGVKALWNTGIGLWTNTLGYSKLENSRRSEKDYYFIWQQNTADKNWARTSTYSVMEGGFSSVDQNQDDVNYKSDMSFEPIDLGVMTHRLRLGGELGYKNVGREVVSDYYYTTQGTINNIGLIDTNGNCDNASSIFGMSLCVMRSLTNPNSNATGKVGQYAKTLNVIPAGGLRLDTFAYGIYLEDDMRLDLSSAGEANMRFGLRFDGDDYMEKHTIAPRFSLNYVAPWKEEYKSTLILGANRYYGRNLFSYRLYDSIPAATKQYTRTSQNSVWIESSVNINSSFRFDKLNVPYADELMIVLSQNFWAFNATLKYIHREGKDEIMRRSRSHSDTNPPALSGYSNTYNYYTNDGSSRSDIITFMLTNIVPLETFGVRHQYLLAFDWTNTKRSYNLFAADEAYADNEMVVYNGQIIPYRDRPTENFALPYTLRLNTTHTFNVWRTRWLWNNFFRYPRRI